MEENAKLKRELPRGNYVCFPAQGVFPSENNGDIIAIR